MGLLIQPTAAAAGLWTAQRLIDRQTDERSSIGVAVLDDGRFPERVFCVHNTVCHELKDAEFVLSKVIC